MLAYNRCYQLFYYLSRRIASRVESRWTKKWPTGTALTVGLLIRIIRLLWICDQLEREVPSRRQLAA